MSTFRWWLFRRLSELGWWVCPEPHKSLLQASMSFDKTMWEDPDRAFAEYLASKDDNVMDEHRLDMLRCGR